MQDCFSIIISYFKKHKDHNKFKLIPLLQVNKEWHIIISKIFNDIFTSAEDLNALELQWLKVTYAVNIPKTKILSSRNDPESCYDIYFNEITEHIKELVIINIYEEFYPYFIEKTDHYIVYFDNLKYTSIPVIIRKLELQIFFNVIITDDYINIDLIKRICYNKVVYINNNVFDIHDNHISGSILEQYDIIDDIKEITKYKKGNEHMSSRPFLV